MTELTAEIVRELLDCDYESGQLTWRIRKRRWFDSDGSWKTWNRKFMGELAFTAETGDGYLMGAVLNKTYKAHRIIWLHKHGEWPNQIDHINGKRSDNRIENLRSVTNQENSRNCSRSKKNTSGVTGVSWDNLTQKWRAQITVDGNNQHIGLYRHKRTAIAARYIFEKHYGFHEQHGKDK